VWKQKEGDGEKAALQSGTKAHRLYGQPMRPERSFACDIILPVERPFGLVWFGVLLAWTIWRG
jgi:hypothetical protein